MFRELTDRELDGQEIDDPELSGHRSEMVRSLDEQIKTDSIQHSPTPSNLI